MRVTFLGTGTSTGVPQIGCQCDVCRSLDPHDKRLRASIDIIAKDGTRIVVDCGPDFRLQMLDRPFRQIDAILITHEHYDHIGGLDDIRPFCHFGDIDIYAESNVCKHIKERMPYCFATNKYPGIPLICLNEILPYEMFRIGSIDITPLRVMHGKLPIVGYLFNHNFAYITDMSAMPYTTKDMLKGIDTLVLNGLRHTHHNTHQTIETAVRLAQELETKRTFITHMSHEAGLHALSPNYLPKNISLAYDKLEITVEEDTI